jgi:cobaltochelatase CobT
VLTGAARALAHEPELEVAWTADNPSQIGNNLRVPMPGRSLPRAQAMEARGFADSMALKLRHHNEAMHARNAPAEPAARACYDAVELVRYEALGSKAYAGIRGNLDAAMSVRMGADPITRAAKADDVPIQAALALMLREHLTGQAIPEAARAGVEMLRSFIEDKAQGDFDALALSIDDQTAFQSLALDMLCHLELTQMQPPDQSADDSDDQGGDEETEDDEQGDNAGEEQQSPEMAAEPSEGEADGDSETDSESADEMEEGEAGDDGEEGMLPVRPNRPWTDTPAGFDYKVFTEAFEPSPAPPDGAAEPQLGFRSGRRHARCRAAGPRGNLAGPFAQLQDRA